MHDQAHVARNFNSVDMMSKMTILAPLRLNSSAIAWPSPMPQPVMTAILSFSRAIGNYLLNVAVILLRFSPADAENSIQS